MSEFAIDDSKCRPWAAWTTILWVVLAEALDEAAHFLLDSSPLETLADEHPWSELYTILGWSTTPIVLVVAVRLARCPVGAYFGWTTPRAIDVALAIGAGLFLELMGHGSAYLMNGTADFPVEDYRNQFGRGMSPWLFLLSYWSAYILSPVVEETTYRGFLWHGLAASRLGNVGAWLITSLLFAAVHYRLYIENGELIFGAFVAQFISGLLFGWVRWRSGSTIAAMIAHATSNLALSVGTVIAVALHWP